jgi:hypothetical protein
MNEREPLEAGLPDDVQVPADDDPVPTMEPVPIPDDFEFEEEDPPG